MEWSEEHDTLFTREIFQAQPYNYKKAKGSPERGRVWIKLAECLNLYDDPKFNVDQRSVRDHLNSLVEKRKKRVREIEKASGIQVDDTEVDIALDDIILRFKEIDDETQKQSDAKKAKDEADSVKTVEMRKRSLETLGETSERNEAKVKLTRNNGSDTINYLREKSEAELKIRKEEVELKRDEHKNQREHLNLMRQQHDDVMKMNALMIQQQTQQQAAMFQFMERMLEK